MIKKNVYKPRYKVAFQAKNKIWPYKNSRLRRFFNIRGRKLIRRGFFKRYFLVFNNMKWTIARRYIKPYMYSRKPVKRRFHTSFYKKQQLRHFYGKIKENNFRKFFKKYISNSTNRNRSFFAALEKRLDMIIFRMRLLPTIFASHQLVHHHGVYINGKLEKSPNALIIPGDIISISKNQWASLYGYLYYRVYYRLYGKFILKKRQYSLLKKKTWWISRFNKARFAKIKLVQKFWQFSRVFINLRKKFSIFIKQFSQKLISSEDNLKNENYKRLVQNTLERILAVRKLFYSSFKSFRLEWKKVKYSQNYFVSWTWKRYNQSIFYRIATLFRYIKTLQYLWTRLKLEELRFYTLLLLSKEGKNLNPILEVLNAQEKQLFDNYLIVKRKIDLNYKLFISHLIKKQNSRLFYKYNPILEKETPRGSALLYFLINKKYNKLRRLKITRLKKVHFYIPRYIHFDFRTMRGVLLYSPLPNEIYYSFNCSLTKIHSFYKTLGL